MYLREWCSSCMRYCSGGVAGGIPVEDSRRHASYLTVVGSSTVVPHSSTVLIQGELAIV